MQLMINFHLYFKSFYKLPIQVIVYKALNQERFTILRALNS